MTSAIRCLLLLLACATFVHSTSKLTYPLKVTYLDNVNWQTQNVILDAVNSGYNVIILSFYMTNAGPVDAALSWVTNVDAATRLSTMQQVHAAGAVVMVSLGGATDGSWQTANPTVLGAKVANWTKTYGLDGVDFDLENPGTFAAVGGTEAATVTYFAQLTNAVRSALGPDGVISIAPVAPWFGPVGTPKCTTAGQSGCSWVGPSGGMTGVYQQVTNAIDFFFIQFYNQGSCYTTAAGLFTNSGQGCDSNSYYPLTSIQEIATGGVPLNKLVVGKPVDTGAATTGYVAPATLHQWYKSTGASVGWTTGSGIWEYGTGVDAKTWIAAAFPSGSATLAPTDAPPTTPGKVTSKPTQRATQGPTQGPTQAVPTAPSKPITNPGSLTYPLKVTYLDNVNWQTQNVILDAVAAGFNVIILSFYLTASGPCDAALSWAINVDNATRASTMEAVHAAGAVVLVSLGGATDGSWQTANPSTLGAKVANWAREYGLDGVDFDLENPGTFAAVGGTDAATITYLATLTTATRAALGAGGIISHAPVAPWFGPVGAVKCTTAGQSDCTWVGPSGGMTALYQQVTNAIDFFFIQFYNQGTCYTTENGLFTNSGAGCDSNAYYPQTSIQEIAAGGVPLSKLVIGKPVNIGAATTGYVVPATLHQWIENSGIPMGWNTGTGIWEYGTGTDANTWIAAAYPAGSATLPPTAGPIGGTQAPTQKGSTQGPTQKGSTQGPTQKAPSSTTKSITPTSSPSPISALKTNDAPRPTIAIAVAAVVVLCHLSLLF